MSNISGEKCLPRRPRIPREVLDPLLVRCRHRCCICGEHYVQVHHIDGNPSNNRESNLIPLCRTHAGMVHILPPSAAGVQRITSRQLRLYKEDWIRKCNSVSPTIFTGIDELRESVQDLKGKVKKLETGRA